MSQRFMEENVFYGLVYKEQIYKQLISMGLSPEDADRFLFQAAKGWSVNYLQKTFTGNDAQWRILTRASTMTLDYSHALANFLIMKDDQ